MPWCITGNYKEDITVGKQFEGIRDGHLGSGWTFPAKYNSKLAEYTVEASIGRSKTDSFDRVMLSVGVNETVSLFDGM